MLAGFCRYSLAQFLFIMVGENIEAVHDSIQKFALTRAIGKNFRSDSSYFRVKKAPISFL